MSKTIKACDLFAGAGGTSTGLLQACEAFGRDVELTAINHDPVAIATHRINHPRHRHLCADLDNVKPWSLFKEGELFLLVASPSCTGHSLARGGKPVDDQSRATAHCVTRWADALRPAIILIENVPEFLKWGNLDGRCKRDPKGRGKTFMAWVTLLKTFGYRVDWRVLCAADYGAPTTRRRLFIQAVHKSSGLRIVWPEPTHAPKGESDLLGARQPWRPAREIIDWSLKGQSIFERKRPLQPKTLARIYAGLEKFGLSNFLVQPCPSGSDACRVSGLDAPLATQPASNRFGLVEPFLIAWDQQSSGSAEWSLDAPVTTVTTKARHGLVEPFLIKMRGTSEAHLNSCASGLETPVPTVSAGGRHVALVEPYLIHANHGGNEERCRSLDAPLPTVTAAHRGKWAWSNRF